MGMEKETWDEKQDLMQGWPVRVWKLKDSFGGGSVLLRGASDVYFCVNTPWINAFMELDMWDSAVGNVEAYQ